MQLDRFLGALSEEAPVGVDLDETGKLVSLDQMARWADTESEPDWPALRDASAAALDRSRDLRAVVYLAAALLHTDGVVAFCRALGLLRNYLEELWDDVYPQLDEGDAIERSSAVFNLIHFHRVIRPLRLAPLVVDRAAGRFSLQDVEIAFRRMEPPQDYDREPPPEGMVMGVFQAMDGSELESLDGALGQAVNDLQAVEAAFRERAGVEAAPDLSRLTRTLADIRAFTSARLSERTPVDAETAGAAEADPATAGGAPASVPAGAASGPVRSRQEAIEALDAVVRYFRDHEPSSPVPLLLERAKRLVDRDFIGILEDMAPDALGQVRTISGKSGDE